MGKNQDPGAGINILDPPHCLSVKNDVNVRSKVVSRKKKTRKKKFVCILKATDEKSLSWIRESEVLIRESGSVLKCHGSRTLVTRYQYERHFEINQFQGMM
jgi:hypothetical protein